MRLADFEVPTRTLNALNKKGIQTTDDLVRMFPRKYLDYRFIQTAVTGINKDCAILGYCSSIAKETFASETTAIVFDFIEESTGSLIKVRWLGLMHMWDFFKKFALKEIVICGKLTYHEIYGYSIMNPTSVHLKNEFRPSIVPIYKKVKGVSNENLIELIRKAFETVAEQLPKTIAEKSKLMNYKKALLTIHYPKNFEEIEEAKKKIIFDDLLYFSLKLKSAVVDKKKETTIISKDTSLCKKYIDSLPYELTTDQGEIISILTKKIGIGERINYLITGDVGCGKTTVAFALMLCIARAGYQSVLLAPTKVVAKQHYEQLKEVAEKSGLRVAYLHSSLTTKEKRELYKGISLGEFSFIVGTHSVFTKTVEYCNLGLIVTDEEHKFGVLQRELLVEKSNKGIHNISMSATPIPRTIADILYGEDKQIYSIVTMPGERKPIQTAINSSEQVIFEFVLKQLKKENQAYIVCPLIEDSTTDDNESESIPLESVESAYKKYLKFFKPKGYNVACINGKMKNEDVDSIINKFKQNKIQILISTTVIEVGVNVPNVTTIVINNAERFGLASLHQLRGRVGRGHFQSYCILNSQDKENQRLQTLVNTLDGFTIAQEDLKQRGIGDLLGTEQSGENRFANLILAMPNLYNCVKKYADWFLETNCYHDFLSRYEEHDQIEEVA